MTTIERAGHLAHARTAGYRRRRARAVEVMLRAFELCRRPYVAFSAGKDSSAMLWLVAELRPGIEAMIATSPEARLLHSDLDFVIEWWRARGVRLFEVPYRVRSDGTAYAPTERVDDRAARMREAMAAASSEYDGCFVGVRSAESRMRAFSNAHFRDVPEWPIYTYRVGSVEGVPGQRRVLPIEAWTEADVWATIAAHDIPTLAAYDGDPSERTTMGFSGRDKGLIAKLRARDPESYQRIVERDPTLGRDA